MEKIIKIGEYEFAAKSTAASLFSYKRNFNRDGLKDLIAMAKGMPGEMGSDSKDEIISALLENDFDFDAFFRFLWVFAKAGNLEIPPLEKWMEGFEMPPIEFAFEALQQSMDLLFDSTKTTVKPKNHPAAALKK